MAVTKVTYQSDRDITITLAALATSSTLLVGREGTAIINTSNLDVGSAISGFITTGTSPTVAKTIEVWAFGAVSDTPTYPDVMDGTDSAETITNQDIKNNILRSVARINVTADSDITYDFGPVSIVSIFGFMPRAFGIFVTHDTAVNLNSSGGNHFITVAPFTYTSE